MDCHVTATIRLGGHIKGLAHEGVLPMGFVHVGNSIYTNVAIASKDPDKLEQLGEAAFKAARELRVLLQAQAEPANSGEAA